MSEIEKSEKHAEADAKQGGSESGQEPTAEEKKTGSLKFWILAAALIIFFLALVYVPKILHGQEAENNRYNGFDFYKAGDGFWYTVVQKGAQPYEIPFYYHPKELEDIVIEPGIKDKFFDMVENNGTIFIVVDPDAESKAVIAGVEIAKITGRGYQLLNVPTYSAFSKEPTNMTTNVETPILNCAAANNKTLVVGLVLTSRNVIYSQDYCIRLEAASYDDMVRVADRMMYNLLGIMLE
jgi:hypothetical protein